MKPSRYFLVSAIALIAAAPAIAGGLPEGSPAATLDLSASADTAVMKGEWRTAEARAVDATFLAPGADGQPTLAPAPTQDIQPHAGGRDFDAASWEKVAPEALSQRRGGGRTSFRWYRLDLTVPEQVKGVSTRGMTLVFETSVDDYAEVWVDGELSRAAGQSGGSVIAGWNHPNRLVVGRNVTPGQRISVAVFGVNGPISDPTTNYIYMRAATLGLYKTPPGPVALEPAEVNVTVVRADPAVNAIVPLNPKLYKLAAGFQFTEGPVWTQGKDGRGFLLFSDPNANTIYRYDGALSVFRAPSGYSGADIAEYRQPGSNGLTYDGQGRLTIDQHGNRRVIRLEADGSETVLADRHDGKRLNSPNDLVYRSDGALYFTDPPFGLPKVYDDPRKETPYSGIYRRDDTGVTLLANDLKGPNGIAFSPDEKFLYVGDWDDHHKAVVRYPVLGDGTLGKGETFFDLTAQPGEDAIDGVKVDQQGNVYISGPGGLWIVSPAGKHLGTIVGPRHPHNMAWGDADGRTLYLTAQDALYRIRLNIPGVRPQGEKP